MGARQENRRVRQMERELYDGRCPKLSPPARRPEGVRYKVIDALDDPVVDGVIVTVIQGDPMTPDYEALAQERPITMRQDSEDAAESPAVQ